MTEQEEPLSLRIMLTSQDGRVRIDIWAAHKTRYRVTAWAEVRSGSLWAVRPMIKSLPPKTVERFVVLCHHRIERERLLWGTNQDRADVLGAKRWLQRQMPLGDAQQLISFFRRD